MAAMRFLSANWLRSATRPLRDRHPAVYARVNSIRNRILTGSTGLSAYQAKAWRHFVKGPLGSPSGKRVLEIGSDIEGAVLLAFSHLGVREVVGVNPSEEIWEGCPSGELRLTANAVLRRADARQLPFSDASFDAIFSVATFEHILGLPAALVEMHRVLRPGGTLYSHFGPIWSGGRGHHLRVRVGDLEARHFKPETNPLPDFSHLLLGPEELRNAVTGRCPHVLIEPIVAWVYEDPGINRLFCHQYRDMVAASPFKVIFWRAETDRIDPQLSRLLSFRYPQEREFGVTNLEICLRRECG